ncbi:MAG: GTPase RsgA, partial [Candidatus Aminicenantales bacterium]
MSFPHPVPPAAGLNLLGWDTLWEEAADPFRTQGLDFGRIIVERRESYILATAGGERDAEVSGRFLFEAESPADFPKVGDWVALTDYPKEAKAVIQAVLPRRARLSRSAAGRRTEEQVLAANIDTIFLVQSLDFDFNVRRLERQMVMVRESGAEPVVLLNKADLCPDAGPLLAEVRAAIPGTAALAVTALAPCGP